MGGGAWNRDDFNDYATRSGFATKSDRDVTNTSRVFDEFLPINFKNGIRESRDSTDNPESNPIIIAADGTGSMGELAGRLMKEGIAKLLPEIYDRKPVTNPQVMVMAIGDAVAPLDRYPIQATQFESDIRIIEQLGQLYMEGRGGGNNSESYSLAWLVAALMTRHDAWEKRNKKGVIFTYGDEEVSAPIPAARIKELLGVNVESDPVTAQEALTLAQRTYDCYHLIIEEGGYASGHADRVRSSWSNLLGEQAIPVSDWTKLPEIITSILQIRGGVDKATVTGSWKGDTAVVVARAVDALVPQQASNKVGVVAI